MRLPALLHNGTVATCPRPFRFEFAINPPDRLDWSGSLSCDIEGSQLYVGDVIQPRSGPGVYPDVRDKYFRVTAIHGNTVSLSKPYHDKALTQPYRPFYGR